MLRSFLALLLLVNYLLVVGAGLRVGRPAPPLYSAAHPYVHNPHCQQENYLRLDCFEQCNGQQQLTTKLPTETNWHFLVQLPGLDVHCPLPTPLVKELASAFVMADVEEPMTGVWAASSGFGQQNYPPPKRG